MQAFGIFQPSKAGSFHLLARLICIAAIAAMSSIAKAESRSTGDTERLYGFMYLHPKDLDSRRESGDGFVTQVFKDGTSVRMTVSEFEIQSRIEQQALTDFYATPSKEAFARLSAQAKYAVATESLLGGPVSEDENGQPRSIDNLNVPTELRPLLYANHQARDDYRRQFDSAALSYLDSLPGAEQSRIRQYALNEISSSDGRISMFGKISQNLKQLIDEVVRGNPAKAHQLICEQLYSPSFEIGNASGFVEDLSILQAVEPLLKNSPNATGLREQSCPMKNGKEFRIGERIQKLSDALKAKFPRDTVEELPPILSRPPLNCETKDFQDYAKAAQLALLRSPTTSDYWGRHEKGACRIMGRVQVSKSGELTFRFLSGSIGDPVPASFKIASFDKLFAAYDATEKAKRLEPARPTNASVPKPVKLDTSAAIARPISAESGASIMNPFAGSATRR